MVTLKKIWGFIVALGALFAAAFYYKQKNKELEAEHELADLDKADALLEKEQEMLNKRADEKVATLEAEKSQKLTTEEMVERLKKI